MEEGGGCLVGSDQVGGGGVGVEGREGGRRRSGGCIGDRVEGWRRVEFPPSIQYLHPLLSRPIAGEDERARVHPTNQKRARAWRDYSMFRHGIVTRRYTRGIFFKF